MCDSFRPLRGGTPLPMFWRLSPNPFGGTPLLSLLNLEMPLLFLASPGAGCDLGPSNLLHLPPALDWKLEKWRTAGPTGLQRWGPLPSTSDADRSSLSPSVEGADVIPETHTPNPALWRPWRLWTTGYGLSQASQTAWCVQITRREHGAKRRPRTSRRWAWGAASLASRQVMPVLLVHGPHWCSKFPLNLFLAQITALRITYIFCRQKWEGRVYK